MTVSQEQIRTKLEDLPRFKLSHLNTPLEPLDRLQQALIDEAVSVPNRMLVKRDDVMRSDRLKQVMQEIDASFDEGSIGFSKFSKFLAEASSRGLIVLKKMDNGQYEISPSSGGGRSSGGRGSRSPDSRGRRGGRDRGGRRGGDDLCRRLQPVAGIRRRPACARVRRAGGNHVGEVRAFLTKYYGTAVGQDCKEPLDTVTANDHFGLVTIKGELFQIVDIGMRMLSPRELYAAQGFPSDYKIGDRESDGFKFSKSQQVAKCGNSVCPPLAAALVRANVETNTIFAPMERSA